MGSHLHQNINLTLMIKQIMGSMKRLVPLTKRVLTIHPASEVDKTKRVDTMILIFTNEEGILE